MPAIMEWDELKLLRSSAEGAVSEYRRTQDKKTVERFCDYMEFVLCLVYAYGWKDAEEIVGIVPFRDGLDDKTVNLEIENKTFRDRVEEQFENGSIEGIMRIIDTEAHRDYNTGIYTAAKESGADGLRKRWTTMNDDLVRDSHSYLEGTEVDLDALFYSYTGASALYPGGFGEPEEDCNCRCWITITKGVA